MNDFFTWDILGTYAGAVTVVAILVQFTKGLPFINKMPTQVWSYILSLGTLLLALPFSEAGWSWDAAALSLFNALTVALAANGAYDAIADLPNRVSEKKDQ